MKLWNSDWPTALAPMQDVTGLPFMKIIAGYGAPDLLFTEFLESTSIPPLTTKFLDQLLRIHPPGLFLHK